MLSTESATIVKNFVTRYPIVTLGAQQLITSLYQRMPWADERVLAILKDNLCPLEDSLTQSEIERLLAEYPAVARECYQWMDDHSSRGVCRTVGITHLNSAYIALCMALVEPKANARVLVPYAGEGRFVPWLDQTDITAYEPNEKAWALAKVFAHPTDRIAFGDDTASQSTEGTSYDYIFAFPPLGNESQQRSNYEELSRLISEQLNEQGTFCAILPYSFCFASSSLAIRNLLKDEEKRYSMAVITLPCVDVYADTDIPLCLVLVTPNHLGNVLLMDANHPAFVSKVELYDTYQPQLKIQSIVETIKQDDEQWVWYRDVKSLDEDLNLQPARYLVRQNLPRPKAGETLMPLSELITLLPQDQAISVAEEELPTVSLGELRTSEHDYLLRRSGLPVRAGRSLHVVYQDSLLLSYRSKSFLVGKLTGVTQEQPAALQEGIHRFQITSDKVTEEYLVHALLDPETQLQAERLAIGVVKPILRERDLLSLQIIVPSLARQEELFKEGSRATIAKAYRELSEAHESFRQDMHMKSHAIGQTIMNINNWWKVLQQARQQGEGVLKDTSLIGKAHPITVAQLFDNIERTLGKLQTQIYKLDRGNGLEVRTFALTTFIEDYIANPANQSPLFTYLYDRSLHHASQFAPSVEFDSSNQSYTLLDEPALAGGDPLEWVDFAPDALRIIFDNIISNATSHAFDPSQPKPGFIKIELTEEGTNYVVTISNNGKPLDKRITAKEVFVYNRSTKSGEKHFGIGGYEVDQLMREFGGEARFESHPDAEFTVAYKLIFNNVNLIKSF